MTFMFLVFDSFEWYITKFSMTPTKLVFVAFQGHDGAPSLDVMLLKHDILECHDQAF
jgi:hypothetical protein